MLSLSETASSSPRNRAWHGTLKARMNVAYYELSIARLRWWNSALQIVTAFCSTGAAVTALELTGRQWPTVGMAAVAGLASVASLVLGFGDKAQAAAALLPEYVRHASALNELFHKGDDVSADDVVLALSRMDQTEVAETQKGLTVNKKLLREAQAAVIAQLNPPSRAA